MKNKKGFTLIELLLVVTILGILAAMAIPRLFPQSEKARVAEAINILSAIRQSEEAYFLANGQYLSCALTAPDTCWQSLGMGNPNPGRYFDYSVKAEDAGGGPSFLEPTFTATATRRTGDGTSNPGNQFSGVIRLSESGVYSCSPATYAYCPKS
jgi:prepilin-type N-terminal cleavage/methylation domain-containing protein